ADFAPRAAVVYLPPAALVADPPALPVVVALSGQPGTPADVFSSAGVSSIAERIADRNGGVAPIVVVPDQLGDPSTNPMCVDSARGESETYLTVDVPAWIDEHLNVSTDREAWTIAGFSQGGTCAIQLGGSRPDLFGSLIDISGERVPSLGDPEVTLRDGFGGDEEAYLAAQPQQILADGAPYPDSVAVFVVGSEDRRYADYMQAVSTAATEAEMTVFTEIAPRSGHDWNTAAYGFETGFALLLDRWGVTR
ncbi:MAG: alpha/beta hydrolase-fold protein, partial [Naasia sp.]